MNNFKKLTIDELMKLLIELTKDNENQIKEFNQSVSLLSKSGKPISEIRNKVKELYGLINESIDENKEFVNLFKALVNFNQYFNNHLEFKFDEEVGNSSAVELNSISKGKNDLNNEEMLDFDSYIESKSPDELQEVLQQYILEEKYEECSKIKSLIEKTSV